MSEKHGLRRRIAEALDSRRRQREVAAALYGQVAAAARREAFYSRLGVPDSLDGRFELLTLHAFILFARLKRDGAATAPLAQAVYDALFQDLDASLRQMGVGDLGIGKRIRRMSEALQGRLLAYEAALGAGAADAALRSALQRNLYGTAKPSEAMLAGMAAYLIRARAAIAALSATDIAAGRLSFPEVVQ